MSEQRTPSQAPARWWFGGASAIMLALLGLPLLALAIRALASVGGGSALFSRPVLDALGLSLGTTAISAGVIILLGTPLAYGLARYRFRLKAALTTLIELPIVMPPIVAGLALLMAFGRRGLLGAPLAIAGISLPFSPAAVVIAQVFVSAPYYIRSAQVRFQLIPRELEQAASIDGADGLRLFWDVTLPLSSRGLIAGLVLSWARALGEFGATILFAGNLQGTTQTMPLLVYGALERDLTAAVWTGLLLVLLAALALALTRWLLRTIDGGGDPLAEL